MQNLKKLIVYSFFFNRVRTTSQSAPAFISASPPGFVSLEEIMKAANSVSKMALAHDIAVDDDFHLEKVDLPNGRLVFAIFSCQSFQSEIIHQILSVFREQLKILHTKLSGIC